MWCEFSFYTCCECHYSAEISCFSFKVLIRKLTKDSLIWQTLAYSTAGFRSDLAVEWRSANHFLMCSSAVLAVGLLFGCSAPSEFLSYFSLRTQMTADGEKVLCFL